MDFTSKTDRQLMDVIDAPRVLAGVVGPTPEDKLIAGLGLQRRRLQELTESSGRLERLTRWLIALTILLGVLTAVLAVPEIARLVARLRTH